MTEVEWGVRFPNEVVNVHANKNDALIEAGDYGGEVVYRTVTEWQQEAA